MEPLREELVRSLDVTKAVDDDEIYHRIDELILSLSKKEYISLNKKSYLQKELFNSIRKLDVLQELIEDETITEIMVNGKKNIFIERDGAIVKLNKEFTSKEKLEDVVQQIVAKCNRTVNESTPMVDARLENGDRVNIILPPVAINGPILTIRRFPKEPIGMEHLLKWGSITQEAAEFLRVLVMSGYNIFISGGTGSGKTTFLNALSAYIPKDERVITIEDNAELQILNIENLVKLESRNANVEGENEITIRDLIKSALRMRPDRIIVGEIRGKESLDLLQALCTGHSGSISTGHANSAADMLSRIETMVLMGMDLPLQAIRRQITSGIDILIHLGRLRDKSRKVLEILEIMGMEEGEIVTNPLYMFKEEEHQKGEKVIGSLEKINPLYHRTKLLLSGNEV
ncbi:MAG TPA: CpaF family protein [Candidatus Merdenecus merdavium]|nr:CpaF family protein [Candidatus Merdenecus merdavium]